MGNETRWLDLIETAADEHLGTTLVRLAALAESAHRFERASALQRKDRDWVHGCDPGAAVLVGRDRTAEAHTEVIR
jgi:hypothetical protein